MQGHRFQETGGVFSAIRRGFLGTENDADAGESFGAVERHYSDRLLDHLLRPHGFEVLTTLDAQNLGNSDAAQLRYAAEHHWTLLTHNRIDYERLQVEGLRDQRPHAGILIANRRASDFDLARRIMTMLDRFTPEEIANHLLYL